MAGPNSPVKMPELHLIPETDGGIELDAGMKQVLSLLTAHWGEKRVTLKASESGVLAVAEPRIKDIKHYDRIDPANPTTCDNISCTEVMVMGEPGNTGIVWVRPDETATTVNAWPLAAWDTIKFTLNNLQQLNMLIADNNDTLIVAYTG